MARTTRIARPGSNDARSRSWAAIGFGLVLGLSGTQAAVGQAPPAQAPDLAATVERLARQLQALERRNATLADQNESLADRLADVTGKYDDLNQRLQRVEPASPGSSLPPLPPSPPSPLDSAFEGDPVTAGAGLSDPSLIDPDPREIGDEPPDDWRLEGTTAAGPSRFLVGDYDDELASYVLVRPRDPQRVPFELRFDLVTQMRYTSFARSTESWVDALGVRQPVRNYQTVEVNRNWVVFTGYGIDPRLQFNATIFSSTAFNDTVFMGWVNYRFNRAFDLRAGNWNVPGTREWIGSFRHTLGADRSMATTFFRPNISPGVWLQGEPITGLHYVAMGVGSLNRFLQNAGVSGPSGGFGGTIRWEPRGPFGLGTSDIENHQKLTPRIGFNTAFSREHNRDLGLSNLDNPENTIIRLSDGTPLSRLAANTPGVEISDVNFKLWTIDAALKYRGLGISGEYFLRRLDGFRYTGGRLPYRSLADHGGMLEAGYFLIPSKLEAFARTSYVSGQFGGGQEYGGGANWYPRGARTWRMTFEVLRINDSPAQNVLTGYRAGESGTLFQAQWLTDF